ncbi:hypothetical protein [Gloeothece verrucosa]|uniref:Uncharacterized protein n=1 Tax=Gloeothece verrucosa (strain PCC 7822) TaxID=497965 RepID=E0UHH5_GLOV7|nr:hypothetical protein [Gloeothece verrucosa]ADN12116.1 hypothetical protein Cyan7822_0064 [Gloeothece verrucosa PCC 7822]
MAFKPIPVFPAQNQEPTARFTHLTPVIEEMPVLTILLAAAYLLAIYFLLTLAKHIAKLARHSSRDVSQVS